MSANCLIHFTYASSASQIRGKTEKERDRMCPESNKILFDSLLVLRQFSLEEEIRVVISFFLQKALSTVMANQMLRDD